MGLAQESRRSAHGQNVVTNAPASRNAFRPSSKFVVKIVRSKSKVKISSVILELFYALERSDSVSTGRPTPM